MPRFFFDICHHGQRMPDEEGLQCEDLHVAKHEAIMSLRDLAAAAIQCSEWPTNICIEVRSPQQKIITTLTLTEVMRDANTPQFGTACESQKCGDRGES